MNTTLNNCSGGELYFENTDFETLYFTDSRIQNISQSSSQWYWNYEYPDEKINFDSYMIEEDKIKDGQKRLLDVDNPLVVPEGTKIKFLITGNDVMHSFFIPSLAVQVYSIAGRINEVWTEIPKGPKTYYGQCNQICGVNHAYMPCLLYTSPSPRDLSTSRMPSSA